MNRTNALTIIVVGLFCWSGVVAGCESLDSEAEILALISAVEHSGAEFKRNGNVHSAAKAADHLRLKFSRGKKHIKSSEDFISKLASGSSMSGKPYWMILDDQHRVTSAEWLTETLQKIRASDCLQDY